MWVSIATLLSGVFIFQVSGRSSEIHLRNNGFTGLVIGIQRHIPENGTLLDAIKEKFTQASKQLYKSTKKRAYFKDITILLPTSWPDKPEYGQVTGELYEKADIIIASPNPRHRNNPYVKTYSGCGDPGVHMHLTPDYLTDPKSEEYYGPTEKLIVHEWAHFRWGVFDEYPTDGEQQFYFSPSTGKLEATRCTAAMRGRIWEYVDLGGGKTGLKFCRIDPVLGTYPKKCNFYPHDNLRWQRGLKGSIMDRQYIPGVDFFCEHNKADPKIHHNSESPSKLNRLCGGKSTWEVIENSMDFKNGNNMPRDLTDADLEPTFKIVRTRDRRVVLVMDTSGSMTTETKLTRMNQAAEQYIQDGIDDNSELGIVEFSTSARMASPMRKIRRQADRDILVNDLVRTAAGGTSIGGGLTKALDMLKSGGGKVQGSLVLLITDGAENGMPRVMDVMPQLFMSGVTVDTLAYTYVADENMAAVSQKTGGNFFYDSNDPKSNAMNDAFFEMSVTGKEEEHRPVQLLSKAQLIGSGTTVSSHVFIEDQLGRDTLFVFTYTDDTPIDVVLTSPTGVLYDNSSAEYNITSLKVIRFRFPMAQNGKWSYDITNPATQDQRISYSATSKPRDKTDMPITVKALMSAVKTDVMKVAVYAEVTKGPYPVTGMTVLATVERLFSTPYEMELHDNGLGADVTKGDGIYSRFFTAFTANGRYSVSVEINNEKGTAAVMEGQLVGEAASFRVDTENPLKYIPPSVNTKTTRVKSEVSRSTTAGAFEFKKNGTFAPFQPLNDLIMGKDEIAPGTIRDLIVSMTSHINGTVSLSWLATGDDEDTGKASQYDIRMAETYAALTRDPELAEQVDQDTLLAGSLSSPKPAGEREHFTIKVDVNPNENASFVFMVRAIDNEGQKGEFSNVATAGLGFVPDVLVVDVVDPAIYQYRLSLIDEPSTNPIPISNSMIESTPTSNSNVHVPKGSSTTRKNTNENPDSEKNTSPFDDPVILGVTIASCVAVVSAAVVAVAIALRMRPRAKVNQSPPSSARKQKMNHSGSQIIDMKSMPNVEAV